MRKKQIGAIAVAVAVIALAAAVVGVWRFASGEEASAVGIDTEQDGLLRLHPPDLPGTPYQRAVREAINARARQGLPVPEASYDYDVEAWGKDHIRLVGTTVLDFDGPEQAGLDEWPSFEIREEDVPPCAAVSGCFVKEGNYDYDVWKYLDAQIPGIWKDYQFGKEPRRFTIDEVFDVTYPTGSYEELTAASPEAVSQIVESFSPSAASGDMVMALSPSALAAMATPASPSETSEILMGFTWAPPVIDWHIHPRVAPLGFEVFEAWAGLYVDVGFGLRLPLEVTLEMDDPMVEEHDYPLRSSVRGIDWDAGDFDRAGVRDPGDEGNEFVAFLEFRVGFWIELLGERVVNEHIAAEFDGSESFTTPFGPGASFPIDPIRLDADDTGLYISVAGARLGVGLQLQPLIGSGKTTADLNVSGDADPVDRTTEYHDTGVRDIGPLTAGDFDPTTDEANARLSDFRYYIDRFEIAISANIQFGGIASPIPDTPYMDILTLDASDLFQDLVGDIYLGVHDGTVGELEVDAFVRSFGIDISGSPEREYILPDDPDTFFTVTVTNTGSVRDTFDTFQVSGLPSGWDYDFGRSEVTLDPGDSDSFRLDITIPGATVGEYPFTISGASEDAKDWDLVRQGSDELIVEVLRPPDPDRYEVNDSLEESRDVEETWVHQHFRCDVGAERGWATGANPWLGLGPGRTDCSSIVEGGAFGAAYEAYEVWRMDIPELSLHSYTDRDFLTIPLPDPGDPAQGGHAPPEIPEPLPECGSTFWGDNVWTGGWLIATVERTANSLTDRQAGSVGESLRLYPDGPRRLPSWFLSEATALEVGIRCPRDVEGLAEVIVSFGERIGEREAEHTGGYTIHLEYVIRVMRDLPSWLQKALDVAGGETTSDTMPCWSLVDPTELIGPAYQPNPEALPRCSAHPDTGLTLVNLRHPFDESRDAGCLNCSDYYMLPWLETGDFEMIFTPRDFDMTVASDVELSYELFDRAQNSMGEAVPASPEKRLFVPQLEAGFYVLVVSGPVALYSASFQPFGAPEGLAAGWNHTCYVGSGQPIEDALADIVDDVQAVYRLGTGQTFERWIPDRPEVSTITTVSSYEPLLILMADPAAWDQTPSDTPPTSLDLEQGWNSVCCLGQDKDVDSATEGIAGQWAALYRLGQSQAWDRYFTGRPEVNTITQLNQYDAVLMLVTEQGGTSWTFDP